MKVTQISRKSHKKRMNAGLRRFLTSVVLFFLIVAVCILIAVFYPMSRELAEKQQYASSEEVPDNAVVIRSIEVTGNRHLSAQNIILSSGLKVGQNFMTISKNAAEANILANCPYVKSVRITSPTYDSYVIAVEEKDALGAMYADGNWVVLGEDYTALGYLTVHGDTPDRYLYIKGAESSGGKLGEAALSAHHESVLRSILPELNAQEITGINCIDLTDAGDLALEWNHQIRVKLGTEVNLAQKIKVMNATLPMVLKNHGKQAEGTMDLSSYSNSDSANQMLYTPEGLLQISTTSSTQSGMTGSETSATGTETSAN